MSLDLERHLVQYGAHHHNSVNVGIHIICVPLIMATGFALATYAGPFVQLPEWLTVPYLEFNLGTIAATVYASLYLLLEPVAGFALAAICMASVAGANYFREQDPGSTWYIALGLHLVSWVAQFIGHGAFEKRAPALLDNLTQALFLAPMFVWLEILFMLGYRPELKGRVNKEVQVKIAQFRAESKNGKAK